MFIHLLNFKFLLSLQRGGGVVDILFLFKFDLQLGNSICRLCVNSLEYTGAAFMQRKLVNINPISRSKLAILKYFKGMGMFL